MRIGQKAWLTALIAGLATFLYAMADVLGKIQSWEVLWNPPGVGQIAAAIAAALLAVGAALKIDPALLRRKEKE